MSTLFSITQIHLFKTGIGLSSTVVIFLTLSYYAVILAWALYYMFNAWRAVLPWSNCNNTWSNTGNRTCSDNFAEVIADYKLQNNFSADQSLNKNDSKYISEHFVSSVEEYYK